MTALYDQELMTPAKLESALRAIGAERYHHRHPFHQLMHEGKLTHPQLQAWALNRYYYQSIIPIKDAIILSRAEDPAFGGPGASASSIMTGTARGPVASKSGFNWRWQRGSTGRR